MHLFYEQSLSCSLIFILSLIVRSEFNLLNLVHVGERVARCLAVLCALESRKYRPINGPSSRMASLTKGDTENSPIPANSGIRF